MTRHYCTYFDQGYLPRGLALYRSLERHGGDFKLWVLCLDEACYDTLTRLNLPRLAPLRVAEMEAADPRLLEAKGNRSRIEYYFTCTPSLMHFVFEREADIDLLTYLDGDMYFFSSPDPIYEELGQGSIGIIDHRYPPGLERLYVFGRYNVGWVSIRRDADGLACLEWWRERCLEWCYDRLEDDRFGDQKYLDRWKAMFGGVVEIQHLGANLAPWNLANYRISDREGRPWVEDQPVIFFHYHGLKQIRPWVFDPNLTFYKAKATPVVRQALFAPYLEELRRIVKMLDPNSNGSIMGKSIRGQDVPLYEQFKRKVRLVLGVVLHRFIYVLNGRVV